MKTLTKIVALAGLIGILSGCGREEIRSEYNVAISPQELVVSSPKDMEEKIRGFNQVKSEKDYCYHAANCLGAYRDRDNDQVLDLTFMAGSFEHNDDFSCLVDYTMHSSELDGASRERYNSQVEQIYARSAAAERTGLYELYQSLSYPVTMHKVLICSTRVK